VAEAQKSRKAGRKAQVAAEASKLAKQISHVTGVKKQLLKEIKAIVASGGGGLFDHSEAMDLLEQTEEEENGWNHEGVHVAKSPLEHEGRSHSPVPEAAAAAGAESAGPSSHSPLEKLSFF